MKPQYIRVFGLFVGLMVVLGLASVVAGESLTDQQIGRQIEHRLSGDAFRNVTVSVHASVVSLSGTVPNLWAKGAAVTKARELSEVESVVVSALDIESAESDRAIVEQMASDIWRVSIPGPSAAARPGMSAAPGIAESRQPPRRFGRHGPGFGPDRNRLSVRRPGFETGPHDVAINPRGAANVDSNDQLFDSGSRGFDVGSHDQLQQQLDRARYAHSGNAFYGIFDYVGSVVDDGVVALTGYVTHGYKANKMVEFVSRVNGVKEIQNQLAVLPSSALDDRLRFSLAANIYGNPLFWNDAIRVVPPVRIIVDNLHVTVAGVVFSEVERRVVADIVQQTPGVLSFRNNLEVETQRTD